MPFLIKESNNRTAQFQNTTVSTSSSKRNRVGLLLAFGIIFIVAFLGYQSAVSALRTSSSVFFLLGIRGLIWSSFRGAPQKLWAMTTLAGFTILALSCVI